MEPLTTPLLEPLRGGLIASCQADPGNPMDDPDVLAAVAAATIIGGAVGLRLDGAVNIAAARRRCAVPIIGIAKTIIDGNRWITPHREQVGPLAEAGADIIAADATLRDRPGDPFRSIVGEAHRQGVVVMADIDTIEAGVAAREAGADIVATTLSGYTPATTGRATTDEPDIELVARLARRLDCPVVAEGRFRSPVHLRSGFVAGAHCVVIGGAITDPTRLTAGLVAATPRGER